MVWIFLLTLAASNVRALVLETKQIVLAQYPYAFNPSIVRCGDRVLMSFRVIPDSREPFNSWIGLVWLGENFQAVSVPQRLDIHGNGVLSRAEDARLISVGDRLYMIFSDNRDTHITRGGFRMYIGEIDAACDTFVIKNVECLSCFPQEDKTRREKNWVPFDYCGELLCAYSLNPHLILQPLRGTGSCETFVSSEAQVDWRWGELRGGTPALADGDHYLAFFHSCQGKDPKRYAIGAYVFSRSLPYQITHMSRTPITAQEFYSGKEYKPYWKAVEVVFPGGFIHDEDSIWLAYGRQDHEMWVARLDKKKLYKSLIPV